MKNLVVTKDEKWIWPANDVNSWVGQKAFLDLRRQIEPYLKGNTAIQTVFIPLNSTYGN